jgi:hypothetical protein
MKRASATITLVASLLPIANSQDIPRESRQVATMPPTAHFGELITGWVLVALVNVTPEQAAQHSKGVMPVTTNLTFKTLASCLAAESEMRQRWADHWNQAKAAEMTPGTLNMILGQVVRGTCVPHRIQ